MKQLYRAGNTDVRPNVVAANAVLNACAYTVGDIREQNRAVEIAHTVLKELESYDKPDQVTYGTFVKVCSHQMSGSSTREQVVEVLFKKCCQDGVLGTFMLDQMKAICTPELFERLVGRSMNQELRLEDLPREWSANAAHWHGRTHRRL